MSDHPTSSLIRDIPDFPKPGIVFKDITPVLANAGALRQVVEDMAVSYLEDEIEVVAGIEARGFILATPVATRLNAGFVPIRKPGKLPYEVARTHYDLEYGTDTLEMHIDGVAPGSRVLIVDDVVATGGTAAAAVELLEDRGAKVVGVSVYVELGFLGGAEALGDVELRSLVRYDD